MNNCSLQFYDFVQDFNLEQTEVGVCFNAHSNFNFVGHNFSMPGDVLMEGVFSNEIDTLHFLTPLTEESKMPLTLTAANHQFLYIHNIGLLIAGDLPGFGPFTISIFPKNNSCAPELLLELKSRKLN